MRKNFEKLVRASVCDKSPGLAEISVSYKSKPGERVKIMNSREAYKALYPLFNADTIDLKEEFLLLLLNRANIIIGWFKLSTGGTGGTIVDIKIIFMLALQANACNLILCHNHPSQNLSPSETDVKLTKKIVEAGSIFDIKILDHLIMVSNGSFFSFADEGII